MQHQRSRDETPAPRLACAVAVLVAASVCACATGVDVTDDELEEICLAPGIDCDGQVGSVSGSGGAGGTFASNGGAGVGRGGAPSSGGTFNSGGGTPSRGGAPSSGGRGGTSNVGTQPLAAGDCLPTEEDDVVIVYTDRGAGSSTSEQASMVLSVSNDGASFDLPALTIRYWFTGDGLSNFIGDIDYASQSGGAGITSSVNVTFGQEFGSDYAQIGFSSGGPVGIEGVETIQVRLHASNYQPMNHANDFSWLPNGAATPNRNLTPYVNGTQAGGCVPIP